MSRDLSMETEAIIAGLVLIDVTATLAGNALLRSQIYDLGRRLTVIETQHKANHRSEVE
jgi:hypothetical protein